MFGLPFFARCARVSPRLGSWAEPAQGAALDEVRVRSTRVGGDRRDVGNPAKPRKGWIVAPWARFLNEQLLGLAVVACVACFACRTAFLSQFSTERFEANKTTSYYMWCRFFCLTSPGPTKPAIMDLGTPRGDMDPKFIYIRNAFKNWCTALGYRGGLFYHGSTACGMALPTSDVDALIVAKKKKSIPEGFIQNPLVGVCFVLFASVCSQNKISASDFRGFKTP